MTNNRIKQNIRRGLLRSYSSIVPVEGVFTYYPNIYFPYQTYNPQEPDEDLNEMNSMLSRFGGYFNVQFVPGRYLPTNVLGWAFPHSRSAEISSDLPKNMKRKVTAHEIYHLRKPDAGEWEVRWATKTMPHDLGYA